MMYEAHTGYMLLLIHKQWLSQVSHVTATAPRPRHATPRPLSSPPLRAPHLGAVKRKAVEGGGQAACHHPMPTGVGVEPAPCWGAHASAAGWGLLRAYSA